MSEIVLTAEQKVRLQLSGNPFTDPAFAHEGNAVLRWLTGGIAPDAHVTFEHQGTDVIMHCPQCSEELGRFDASYGPGTGEAIAAVRTHTHRCA